METLCFFIEECLVHIWEDESGILQAENKNTIVIDYKMTVVKGFIIAKERPEGASFATPQMCLVAKYLLLNLQVAKKDKKLARQKVFYSKLPIHNAVRRVERKHTLTIQNLF